MDLAMRGLEMQNIVVLNELFFLGLVGPDAQIADVFERETWGMSLHLSGEKGARHAVYIPAGRSGWIVAVDMGVDPNHFAIGMLSSHSADAPDRLTMVSAHHYSKMSTLQTLVHSIAQQLGALHTLVEIQRSLFVSLQDYLVHAQIVLVVLQFH